METKISDVKIICPEIHADARGFFLESFNLKKIEKMLERKINFVQDNHSHSLKNVLRGLHYQLEKPQAKLVRVTQGEVFDVAVDLRVDSPTFGEWVGHILSSDNHEQIWIPEGFAHGFYVLSEYADLHYKSTEFWFPNDEHTILWHDLDLNIKWPLSSNPIISEKDAAGVLFKEAYKYIARIL